MKKLIFISLISFAFFACKKEDTTGTPGTNFSGTWTMYDTVPGILTTSIKSFTITNTGTSDLTVSDFPLNTYSFTIGKNTTSDVVTSLGVIPYSIPSLTITKVNGSSFTYAYTRYECAGILCLTAHRGRAVKN